MPNKKWTREEYLEFKEYALISQDARRIERYQRQPDNQWLYATVAGLDAAIDLPSIGGHLRLADVYQQVSFDQPDEPLKLTTYP